MKIDAGYVDKHVGDLAKNTDLSRFIVSWKLGTFRNSLTVGRGACLEAVAVSPSRRHAVAWRPEIRA